MSQAQFAHSAASTQFRVPAAVAALLPLTMSIFADRTALRAELAEDAEAAGFRAARKAPLAALVEDDGRPLGDVVLVDCPVSDGSVLAGLARLDMRARQSGAELLVSTSMAALDDVFACLDQSRALILVDPGKGERIVALGRVLAGIGRSSVRELSEADRMMFLRLTEQVGQIAQRLDRLDGALPDTAPRRPFDPPFGENSAFAFATPKRDFFGLDPNGPQGGSDKLVRAARPPLPDPRLVRRIIRQRQLRARFFDGELFGDPAWDMLLDLTAARAEHTRVSVTSLCIASGVPPTTALRWIGQLTEAGLFERVEDEADRRRAFIALTDKAAELMARYFAELGAGARQLA
jgi:hypothetical protein